MLRSNRFLLFVTTAALGLSIRATAQPSRTLNCWDEFPVQSNTVNGGPFGDTRQGSCLIGTNYVRVVEGQTEGYSEVTFSNLPPLTCFDVIFEFLNDGEDAGSIELFAGGRLVGAVQGNGHHDLERCESVTFHNVPVYTTSLTIRLVYHELVPSQIRHNGAVSLTFRPSQRQPLQLAVTGNLTPGSTITLDVQADPNCESLLGYYLAGAESISSGTVLPDGRIFPLDSPIRVSRGTLDFNAHSTTTLRLPSGNGHVGRTYYFAFVVYLPPGTETGTVGRISPVVPVTLVSR